MQSENNDIEENIEVEKNIEVKENNDVEENNEDEEWIKLDDFPKYDISSLGRLRSLPKFKILKFRKTKGYFCTNIYSMKEVEIIKNSETVKIMKSFPTTVRIHVLVAKTFKPNDDPRKKVIDHINRNTYDNRSCNLRWATLSENCANCKKSKKNTSGVKGVSWDKSRNKYITTIQCNGIKTHIGYFETVEEAAIKRREKEIELFGEFRPTEN
jgi:hypothetical protein